MLVYKAQGKPRWVGLCVVAFAIFTSLLPAFANETLTDPKILSFQTDGLAVFPGNTVSAFNSETWSREILSIDFYDWRFPAERQIVPNPHTAVKFMRISQVSRDPNVVRVVFVFNEPKAFSPRIVGHNLVLEPTISKSLLEPPTRTLAAIQPNAQAKETKSSFVQPVWQSDSTNVDALRAQEKEVRERLHRELEERTRLREFEIAKMQEVEQQNRAAEMAAMQRRDFVRSQTLTSSDDFVDSPPFSRMAMPPIAPGERMSNEDYILDQRVSLEFNQQDLMIILDALASKFNLRIFADAGVKGKFSIKVREATLRDVLKNLLLQRDFQYTLKGTDLTVISLNTESGRIARELLFRDLSLKDALQTLSKMMNINLIIHGSVIDRRVNFYVENLNLNELLELLVTTNNLVMKSHSDNTYIILERENAAEFGTRYYRTFKLVNTTPSEVVEMIASNRSLSEKVNTSNFSLNERINTLSVYDTAENISLIEKVILSVDEKVQQAVIEVKLVEINRLSLQQMGVKLDNFAIDVSDIGRLPSNYALPATLDFLEREDKAKVLASPKIRALHGKKAIINIGEVIPVPYFRFENSTDTLIGGVPQVYREYRDVQVGIRLEVTPHITRDNEISMELNTTVDSVLDINEDGQIRKAERNTQTFVRIKNGETVVLGGLINHQGKDEQRSPSVLNKIPLLRNFVSHRNNEMKKSEMVMLVTPRLVNLDYYENNNEMHAYSEDMLSH